MIFGIFYEKFLPSCQALVGASFSLAFLLGPSVGAYFSVGARARPDEFDPCPARLAMVLTGLELALLLFLMPETLAAKKKTEVRGNWRKVIGPEGGGGSLKTDRGKLFREVIQVKK